MRLTKSNFRLYRQMERIDNNCHTPDSEQTFKEYLNPNGLCQ